MSATTHRDTPCWEVYRPDTGMHPNEESWPHHATRELAEAEQAEWAQIGPWGDKPVGVEIRQSFTKPCVKIVCDGCGDELDASGEGWTHFEPDDPDFGLGVGWGDMEWVERDGKHYHEDCAPPWCEDCEVEGHDVDDCPGPVPAAAPEER
jgi:hypothetical protein